MEDFNVTMDEKFTEEFNIPMMSQIQLTNQRVAKTLTNLNALTQYLQTNPVTSNIAMSSNTAKAHIRKMLEMLEMVVSIEDNRKNPWIIRDVFRTCQTSKMKVFAKTVNNISR